jgi:hypothetical protein
MVTLFLCLCVCVCTHIRTCMHLSCLIYLSTVTEKPIKLETQTMVDCFEAALAKHAL